MKNHLSSEHMSQLDGNSPLNASIDFSSISSTDSYCQTSDLGLRLEVDFVFPLSQEEEQQQEQA